MTETAIKEDFTVEHWSIDRLIPYARNPRKNDGAVNRMVSSIREFGFKIPVLARSTGEVVDGHLRLKAAQKLKMETVPVMLCNEWTDAQVKAFRLLVNRSVTWAQWDDDLLALEMQELKGLEFDLNLTGFDEDEWTGMLDSLSGNDSDMISQSLLPRMQITIADPKTVVKRGDLWRLGKHVLACDSVIDGWERWQHHLQAGSLFCPFPGPFVLLSVKAVSHPLVLVQPDTYVAGHIIDRYIEVHGETDVVREVHQQ
jgi:hypothetical protein